MVLLEVLFGSSLLESVAKFSTCAFFKVTVTAVFEVRT